MSVWAGTPPDPAVWATSRPEAALEAQKAAHRKAGLVGGELFYWPLSPWLQITHTGQLMAKKQYIQSVHINISNVHFIHK